MLALLTYAPETVRDALGKLAPSADFEWLLRLKGPLKFFLVAGILRRLNRALNTWANNNWYIRGQSGWDWPSEVAVITGGCGGIALEVTKGLTQRGVKVAILDIKPLPKELEGRADILYLQCDITSSEEVGRAAEKIRAVFGHPSILVNSAGICNRPVGVLERTEADLRHVVNVNLVAHWFTIQQFVPHMVAQNKGHVVSVASMSTFTTLPERADYSATKAGVLSLHEGLRTELKYKYRAPAVLTTIVHPFYVDTPMTEEDRPRILAAMGSMLSSADAAAPILAQIFDRKGGQLILPGRVWPFTLMKAMPNWFQELCYYRIGNARSRAYNETKPAAAS